MREENPAGPENPATSGTPLPEDANDPIASKIQRTESLPDGSGSAATPDADTDVASGGPANK